MKYDEPIVGISGQVRTDDEIPYAAIAEEPIVLQTSLRARAKRKLRKARLKAAMAKWIVQELTRKYYEKYGTLEGADKESVLSSDADSEDS